MLNYIRITAELFVALRGNHSAFMVLMVLLFNRNVRTNHTKYLPVSEIANMAGLSTSHTHLIIKELKDSGYIEEVSIRNNKKRGDRMYYLTILEVKPELAESSADEAEADIDDAEERWDAYINKLTGGKQA